MLGKLKNRLLAGRNLRRYHDAMFKTIDTEDFD